MTWNIPSFPTSRLFCLHSHAKQKEKKILPKMEAEEDAAAETSPATEKPPESGDTSPEISASSSTEKPPGSGDASPECSASSSASAASSSGARGREMAAAVEAAERDAAAIAESYASLFASLRLALSKITSTSVENMECFGDVVGRLQESTLEAASKGNKYINSCLRLNEEMRGLESLAMQLKILRKSVDSLDLAVNQLLRIP